MTRPVVTIDGNEATSLVAFKLSEVIAIYPITPSSASLIRTGGISAGVQIESP